MMNDKWHFNSLNDTYQWGRYKYFTIGDVINFNSSYFFWCINEIEQFTVSRNLIKEIRLLYPKLFLHVNLMTKIRETNLMHKTIE